MYMSLWCIIACTYEFVYRSVILLSFMPCLLMSYCKSKQQSVNGVCKSKFEFFYFKNFAVSLKISSILLCKYNILKNMAWKVSGGLLSDWSQNMV